MEGEENRLLLTHARRWAAHKGRALDVGLLGNVLDLRRATDDRPPGSWPTGSAEHLVRVSRPGSGPAETPAGEELQATLDSFWRFLRGTGRMSSESADPADLVRELRRALSYLPASAERDHRSPEGRPTEVGEGPGSETSRSRSLQHLPERLERMVNAWNKLRERDRRQRLSESGFDVDIADPAGPLSRPVDPVASAGAARSAAFVQACLRLADWVGPRREVTSSGVLRPAVAREAYEDLDLFTWERAHLASYRAMPDFSEDMWQEVRLLAPRGWKSARDCVGLNRLWSACQGAGLVAVARTVARRTDARPQTDPEWRRLGLTLLLAHALGESDYRVEPLLTAFLLPLAAADRPLTLTDGRRSWLEYRDEERRVAGRGAQDDDVHRIIHLAEVDTALHMFDDTGLWTRSDERLSITEFGRDVTAMLVAARRAGLLEREWLSENDRGSGHE